MKSCQGLALKFLLLIIFYNFIILYNSLATLYNVFFLHNNLVILYKFIR